MISGQILGLMPKLESPWRQVKWTDEWVKRFHPVCVIVRKTQGAEHWSTRAQAEDDPDEERERIQAQLHRGQRGQGSASRPGRLRKVQLHQLGRVRV